MCAFDKNPNIPIDVINISMSTAVVRYVFRKNGDSFQFLYNQDAVTSFAHSNTEPIITTGQNAPGNMVAKPMIE